MKDSEIIGRISILLEKAQFSISMHGDYLAQAETLAHQLSEPSEKQKYLDIIKRQE